MRWAESRCTARIQLPKVTTYSMSFTERYARSTEGMWRNISGRPERIRRRNSAADTVPSQKE
jgi:hypothetical protein